ncbi:Mlp family lipoprotein (plasmid) [Borrelia puertoricensis]|uniref:Mlp family lipoprotein n=1 Tax=Borrelia puertoricensis TaxID=2756107 RepID=UPI003EB98D1B
MKKVNFILFALLLINSCDWFDFDKDVKSRGRSKREVNSEQTEEVQKTTEELLKKKLSDTQKQGLNFLKNALDDNVTLNQILSLDENKVKAALDHIQSELDKCNGENSKNEKTTFKTLIKEYFKSNSNDLDNFKEQTSSTCNGRGS